MRHLGLAPPLYLSGLYFHIAVFNIFSLQAYNPNVNILSFKILLKDITFGRDTSLTLQLCSWPYEILCKQVPLWLVHLQLEGPPDGLCISFYKRAVRCLLISTSPHTYCWSITVQYKLSQDYFENHVFISSTVWIFKPNKNSG